MYLRRSVPLRCKLDLILLVVPRDFRCLGPTTMKLLTWIPPSHICFSIISLCLYVRLHIESRWMYGGRHHHLQVPHVHATVRSQPINICQHSYYVQMSIPMQRSSGCPRPRHFALTITSARRCPSPPFHTPSCIYTHLNSHARIKQITTLFIQQCHHQQAVVFSSLATIDEHTKLPRHCLKALT